MAFTPEEEKWLSETWAEWQRSARLTGKKIGFEDFMDFKWFFRDFVRAFRKAGFEAVQPRPPYYNEWDYVDHSISRSENEDEIAEKFGVKFEEKEEEVTSLPDLLNKLGVPELPKPDDPYASMIMENLVKELAERLKDAEAERGKIKVTIAGKKRIWGAKKVYEFVDELRSKIGSLEAEKERLLGEREKFKGIEPIKLRVLKAFKEGILEYSAGSIVETRDIDWAIQKIEQGFAERVGVEPIVRPIPPPTAPPKEIFRPPEKPPEKPPTRVLPPIPEKCPIDGSLLEEVTRVPLLIKDPLELTSEEEYWRASVGLPIPTTRLEWIEVPLTMKVWICKGVPEHFFERDALGRLVERTPEYLYRRILRETARFRRIEAPAAEFVPPEVRTRFLQWVRRWEAPEAGKKAYQLHPKDWLLTKGIAWGDFLKLPDDERKRLLEEYDRLSRERK